MLILLAGRDGLGALRHASLAEHVGLVRSVVERRQAPRSLRRVSRVLPLTRRLTHSSAVFVFLSFAIVFATVVHYAVHAIFALALAHFVVVEAEAGSATGAPALAFVVASQCVSAGKPAATLRTGVRTLSRVQLGVALQVVQTAESSLARGTFVGLLLAMC